MPMRVFLSCVCMCTLCMWLVWGYVSCQMRIVSELVFNFVLLFILVCLFSLLLAKVEDSIVRTCLCCCFPSMRNNNWQKKYITLQKGVLSVFDKEKVRGESPVVVGAFRMVPSWH